jgi:hypothetical protein
VIPPRRNRKQPRNYDKALYRLGGKRILTPQALAGHCDAVRQKHRVILGRRTDQVHRTLGGYLVTTLSSMMKKYFITCRFYGCPIDYKTRPEK